MDFEAVKSNFIVNSDYDLSEVCVDKCDDDYLQCVSSCSASECLLECGRALMHVATVSWTCKLTNNLDLIAIIKACPCHTDCIDGCSNCENPICFCNDAKNDDNFDALRKTVKVWDNALSIVTMIVAVKPDV